MPFFCFVTIFVLQAYSQVGQKIYLDFRYEISVNKLFKENNHLCNIHMNQNYDTEIYKMVANKNEESLNCSVPFHPPTKSNITGNFIEICKTSIFGKRHMPI